MGLVKTTLSVCLTLLFSFPVFSQKNNATESYFAYDAKWESAPIDKAVYFARAKKVNDTCWQWDTYFMTGPLIKTERFKDKEGTIAHGDFYFYKPNGHLDSMATFSNNLAQGSWYFLNDTGRYYLQKDYDKGHLLRTIDLIKRQDSIKKANPDTADEKKAHESMFIGNTGAWVKFLNQNLKYPERAIKNNKQGRVDVIFIVDEKGNVSEPVIFNSVEFSLDEEALRIIRKSRKWEPAIKDGKAVKSFKRQPIVFRLE